MQTQKGAAACCKSQVPSCTRNGTPETAIVGGVVLPYAVSGSSAYPAASPVHEQLPAWGAAHLNKGGYRAWRHACGIQHGLCETRAGGERALGLGPAGCIYRAMKVCPSTAPKMEVRYVAIHLLYTDLAPAFLANQQQPQS